MSKMGMITTGLMGQNGSDGALCFRIPVVNGRHMKCRSCALSIKGCFPNMVACEGVSGFFSIFTSGE